MEFLVDPNGVGQLDRREGLESRSDICLKQRNGPSLDAT